jgi:rfaE bifunctional protein kinase chain/domain
MTPERFAAITERFPRLRIAVVGDFFLDSYLHIDSTLGETSIETGLPVHNVVDVSRYPGAAGTILNNLVALGTGTIHAVGFCGDDGEGHELRRALAAQAGVDLEHFLTTATRRTPVYCKPMLHEPGALPRELSRLDTKNWTATPETLQRDLAERVRALADRVDALLLMDQVDVPETGVVTRAVYEAAHAAQRARPGLLVLADSRRGLAHVPPLAFKMNLAEFHRMTGATSLDALDSAVAELASRNAQPVFVTLAEGGIVGATPGLPAEHAPAHPVRGPIDIVGAGDAVTSNLAAAIAAAATPGEAMRLAMAAASIVIHQIGRTGTASVAQIAERLDLD